MQKSPKIEVISDLISNCTNCSLHKTRNNTVPGSGNSKAEIFLIGEAPGANEDIEGIPFIGRAGKVLDELLNHINLSRNDIFITNMIKCRPPKNRDPFKEEIFECSQFIDMQIQYINPKVIITLGNFAFQKFFPDKTMSESRGFPHKWKHLTVFPMYHPAAALYNPNLKTKMFHDFEQIHQILYKLVKSQKNHQIKLL